MDLFRVGTQIQQTVKSMSRLRVIANVMARYGFAELLQRMDLRRFVPFSRREERSGEAAAKKMALPERVRRCFEELGPTFIKLGQLLSIRPDLVPDSFIQEFTKLQDSTTPIPTSDVRKVIEEELEGSIEKVFLDFEEQAVASASIAQVHGAILHDGTEVVVKVQKPGIQKIVETDLIILAQLAQLFEKYIPESRVLNPTGLVREFQKNLRAEINFSIEANNIKRIAQQFKGNENLIIPSVYNNLSTAKVLTLQRLRGISFHDKGALIREGVDIHHVCQLGAQIFFRMVFVNGVFHSDPHGGNVFVIDKTKIGLVDFGSVGRLSQRTRDGLANMFLGLASEDYDIVVHEYLEMGTVVGKVDIVGFSRECREIVEPNFGIPLSEVNIGTLIRDLTIAATRYNIRASQDLMLLTRALLTLDGVVRQLDPTFDLFSEMGGFVRELIKTRYSPQRLMKELLWIVQDASSLLRVLPRQLKHLLTRITNEEFTFQIEIPGLKEAMADSTRSRQFLASIIFISTIFLCSTLLITNSSGILFWGFSSIGIIGYGLGFSLLFLAYLFLFRAKKRYF